MIEDKKLYGDWIFYIVVIYVLALCGIVLYFPWHKAGNLTTINPIGVFILALGFMGMSFSIGLLWNRLPDMMKKLDSSPPILLLFLFGKDIVNAVQKGINYSLIVNVILVMLMLLVLPFHIGRWISHKRQLRSVEGDQYEEKQVLGEDHD